MGLVSGVMENHFLPKVDLVGGVTSSPTASKTAMRFEAVARILLDSLTISVTAKEEGQDRGTEGHRFLKLK